MPRGSPFPRAFQWETSTRPMETRWGRGRDCRSVRPQGCVSSCESVSPCFPLRDLAAPGGTCLGNRGARRSAPWALRLLGQWGCCGLRAAAALHVPAQLCHQLCGCVHEGHGIFLNGFFLRNVPVFMQFMIFPHILAVTVTQLFLKRLHSPFF